MKKLILLISFLTLSWNTFSQTDTTKTSTSVKTDTTQVCLPTPVARLVAKDLVRYDGCVEEVKLLNAKIFRLEDISKVKSAMLDLYAEKEKNNTFIIEQKDIQIDQYKNLTNDLKSELKSQRNTTFWYKLGTVVGIVTTSYLLLN